MNVQHDERPDSSTDPAVLAALVKWHDELARRLLLDASRHLKAAATAQRALETKGRRP